MKLVAVLALVAIVGGITLVAVGPAGGAETLRFRIAFRLSEFHEVDNNGDGDVEDAGDQETGGFVLKKQGDKAGHLNFSCIQSENSPPRDLCWATIRVTGKGTVTVHGSQSSNTEHFTGAITGGTGAYRGAGGVIELNFRDSSATLRID
jgi:hypothetical protein